MATNQKIRFPKTDFLRNSPRPVAMQMPRNELLVIFPAGDAFSTFFVNAVPEWVYECAYRRLVAQTVKKGTDIPADADVGVDPDAVRVFGKI